MDPKGNSRRAVLRKCLLAAGVTAVALPSTWRKPLVNSVILPAHAQTSPITSAPPSFTSGRVTNVTTTSRTPSGGTAVTALASIEMSGCLGVAGVSVSCTLEADLGGTTLPLGTASATSDASGSYSLPVTVPIATVAEISSIDFISAVCTAGTTTQTIVLFPSDWAAALAGSPPSPAACAI